MGTALLVEYFDEIPEPPSHDLTPFRLDRVAHLVVLARKLARWTADNEVAIAATEPEMKDGRYTGRVAGTPNMREGKVTRLEAWLGERAMALDDFRQSWFYSDSVNDLPLLSRVTHPVAVNPDPPLSKIARERGWPQLRIR